MWCGSSSTPLQAGVTDEQRAEWVASDPLDWANEFVRESPRGAWHITSAGRD